MVSYLLCEVVMVSKRQLKKLVRNFGNLRIGIVGDMVADTYITGITERVSREAPVLIVRQQTEHLVPGGAANVAMNLTSLGAAVDVAGVIGADRSGENLKRILKDAGINVRGIVVNPACGTISKTRILAGAKHTLAQQVLRLDCEPNSPPTPDITKKILGYIRRIDRNVDGWIVSDYGYRLIDDAILEQMRKIAKNKPVLADSRFDIMRYSNLTVIKPNELEALSAAEIENNGKRAILSAAEKLKRQLDPKVVIITLGNQGMLVYQSRREYKFIPAVGTDKIVDLTGAGDTSAAVLLLSISAGADFYESAYLANCAGSVVVMKYGSASCSQKELLRIIDERSA